MQYTYSMYISPNQHSCTEMRTSQTVVYLVALQTLSKIGTTDWGFCRLQHVQYTGQSPVFSSRGAKKPEGGAINQKGRHIFNIQYWMYAAAGGPNVKCGWHRFQMGGLGTTAPPAGDDPDSTQISPYQHFCTEMRISQSVVSRLFEGCILIRI